MPGLFSISISNTLIEQKEKDYIRLIILLFSFICYTLIFIPLLKSASFTYANELLQIGSLASGVLLLYLIFRMVRNFVHRKLFLHSLFYLMGSGILLGSLANNSFFPLSHDSVLYSFCLSIAFLSAVIGMVVCLYFMLKDIFAESHTLSYRLWGAAAIYLMILLLFTDILGLLQVFIRDGLGEPMNADVFSYVACFKFCFYAMAGIDLPYPNAKELFQNVVAVQGLLSNLYIVLLVGRVLNK